MLRIHSSYLPDDDVSEQKRALSVILLDGYCSSTGINYN